MSERREELRSGAERTLGGARLAFEFVFGFLVPVISGIQEGEMPESVARAASSSTASRLESLAARREKK